MLETFTTLLGTAIAIGLLLRFVMKLRAAAHRRAAASDAFFAKVRPLIDNARYEGEGSIGYPQMVGRYRNLPVRLYPVIDTLAIRKLPSLWLLATLPEPLPIKAIFDLLIRRMGMT